MTRIKEPLTIQSIIGLGYITPPTIEPFNPDSNWHLDYRVLSSSGYHNKPLAQSGFFRVNKNKTAGKLVFKSEKVLLAGVMAKIDENFHLYKVSTTDQCLDDKIRTPIKYKSKTDFIDSASKSRDLVSGSESFNFKKLRLSLNINGFKEKKHISGNLITQAGLIDLVQNLDFDSKEAFKFYFAESPTAIKPSHTLKFRGKSHCEFADGKKSELFTFEQIGFGIMPTEYWLDKNHRLLAMINSGRIYVLDQYAAEPLPEIFTKEGLK